MTSQSLVNTLHIDSGRFNQCVVDKTIPLILFFTTGRYEYLRIFLFLILFGSRIRLPNSITYLEWTPILVCD